ncbi:MAG TPA: glycosyltransferase family 4 protein [Nitrososphaerales archaeon]|nr:glycosyltransferase family 4 protein [Nitrososphaerales archaeon]
MRVCLVSYEFPPSGGGEASYTRALATQFSKAGHDVTLVLPVRPKGLEETSNLRVLATGTAGPIRGARFLSGTERALDQIARTRPDVVHVTFDYPTFLLHLGQRGIPCVATVHHLHLVEALSMSAWGEGPARMVPAFLKASVLNSLETRLLRQCDTTIAVSRHTASTVERYMGIDPLRMRVVMNGIDTSPFEKGDGDVFREAFPRTKERSVLYVGRLNQSKGVQVLLDAFAMMLKTGPASSLVLVGTGEARFVGSLRDRAASLGISEDVVFAGRISDSLLPHAFAASSMSVLPSYMEGFGLSVLESMASSRPAVATKVGGVPEVLVDGETGLLVRPGDAKGLSDAMGLVLSDQALARRMGEAGRRAARERFTADRMADETLDVYAETVALRDQKARRTP